MQLRRLALSQFAPAKPNQKAAYVMRCRFAAMQAAATFSASSASRAADMPI
jgi:hypothetical protein